MDVDHVRLFLTVSLTCRNVIAILCWDDRRKCGHRANKLIDVHHDRHTIAGDGNAYVFHFAFNLHITEHDDKVRGILVPYGETETDDEA